MPFLDCSIKRNVTTEKRLQRREVMYPKVASTGFEHFDNFVASVSISVGKSSTLNRDHHRSIKVRGARQWILLKLCGHEYVVLSWYSY